MLQLWNLLQKSDNEGLDLRCFKCGKSVRIAASSPKQHVHLIKGVDVEIPNRDPKDDKEDLPHVDVKDDTKGLLLYIQRLMHMQQKDPNSEKDKHLQNLGSWNKIKEYMYPYHWWSTENMVSTVMVEKLNLKLEKEASFVLDCLAKWSHVVKHKTLVTFSIDELYEGSMVWDVALLLTGHILLGRPWLYNHVVQHP